LGTEGRFFEGKSVGFVVQLAAGEG
jgi:hypothetical protein